MTAIKNKGILRYKADLRLIVLVVIYAATTYVPFYFFDSITWWQVTSLTILNGFLCFFLATAVHNTVHHPIFTKKSWNKTFQFILTLVYGYSVSAFVPGHNFSHHKETQTLKDSTRTSKARFKWNFLNQFLFFFISAGDILDGEIRFAKRMYKEKRTWFYQWLFETLMVGGMKLALLFIDWKAALTLVWLPHQIGSWGLVGTNYWQHDGTDQYHPYNHSRSFTDPIFNFFMFNNGYHGAHHDKPGMHWSLYPAYHNKNIAPYIHPNLNRNSFLGYCWEAFIYPGKRVDYLGNALPIPPKMKDMDWVADVNIYDPKNKNDLGADVIDEVESNNMNAVKIKPIQKKIAVRENKKEMETA